jgi:hypothetical protein
MMMARSNGIKTNKRALVDLSTLAYCHETKKYYLDADWEEEQDKWTFKPSRKD